MTDEIETVATDPRDRAIIGLIDTLTLLLVLHEKNGARNKLEEVRRRFVRAVSGGSANG